MKFTLDETTLLLKLENVQLVDRSNPKLKTTGTLNLTSTHLVFFESDSKREIWIYHSLISSVEKQPLNISGSPILIKCKHFLSCLFLIPKERDCQTLNLTLLNYSRPTKYQDLLCFKENDHLKFLKEFNLNKNQKIFKLESEYARMGLPNNKWTLTDINSNYEICDTYPNVLFVPSSAGNQILQASANFRSRGRLPVLSYLHHNGASICRCAQPLTGFNGRCVEDEQLIQHILLTNENSKFAYVVDTRPKINAMANMAQGKGYENEANYANIQFYFIGIENIHVMRSSLQKLVECSEVSSNTSFLTGLEKSEWIKHIKAIIDTSVFIMEAVNDQNVSVIVHCSDGWDRTAQTCALASLLLDPYYRSIHGFQNLIEKEWLMFGHKFSHRCGHLYESDSSLKEISPIFSQFLECVWQLIQQFPCAFEFNESYLIKLYEHVYSCQFGTFIGNNQKERNELKLDQLTYSVWDYIQYKINDYINPIYVPNSTYSNKVLRPDTRIFSLKFWRSLYNRFDSNINPNEKLTDVLSMLSNNTSSLNEYAKLLEKRCIQLRTIIKRSENESHDELQDNLEKTFENNLTLDKNESNQMTNSFLKGVDSDLTLDKLSLDYNSIELNWKSSRKNCNCFEPFDYASSKLNCSKCGEIYCERCVENGKYISSQVSTKLVFICDKCLNQFDLD